MQTNLRIKSISNADGKTKVTDNITYVNPNLSDANAKLLAMKINALTLNAYDTTERIDTRDLDTDSKTDYEPQFQTSNLDSTTGENVFNRNVPASTNTFTLNLTPFIQTEQGGTLPFRYQGGTEPLIQAEAPVLTIITSNSNFMVEHRNTNYGTNQNPSVSARGLYQMDLNIYGDIVAGDSFTVTTNVNGDATHNPYERTVTYNFVQWSGGE